LYFIQTPSLLNHVQETQVNQFSFFYSDYKNHKLILAGGNKPGYSCIFFRFIENDLTVIILSNLSSAPVYGIAGEVAECIWPNKRLLIALKTLSRFNAGISVLQKWDFAFKQFIVLQSGRC